jgi:hypothetical protein
MAPAPGTVRFFRQSNEDRLQNITGFHDDMVAVENHRRKEMLVGGRRQVAADLGTARGRGQEGVPGRADALAAGTGAAEIYRSAGSISASQESGPSSGRGQLRPAEVDTTGHSGPAAVRVKTVTAEPDKPSPSHWLEFALLVAVILMSWGSTRSGGAPGMKERIGPRRKPGK